VMRQKKNGIKKAPPPFRLQKIKTRVSLHGRIKHFKVEIFLRFKVNKGCERICLKIFTPIVRLKTADREQTEISSYVNAKKMSNEVPKLVAKFL
jgi:hypothetical protein